jgi:hypothetical protein
MMVVGKLSSLRNAVQAALDVSDRHFDLFGTGRFCDKPGEYLLTGWVQIITPAEPDAGVRFP